MCGISRILGERGRSSGRAGGRARAGWAEHRTGGESGKSSSQLFDVCLPAASLKRYSISKNPSLFFHNQEDLLLCVIIQ